MLLDGHSIDKLFIDPGEESCAICEFIRTDLDHFLGLHETEGK